MKIYSDYDFRDLYDKCWSGAIDALEIIQENEKEEELMNYLEEVFFEEIPSIIQVNDFLGFESDVILEDLEIEEKEEEEEEE